MNQCAICQKSWCKQWECNKGKNCKFELSNQHKMIDDFYFNEFPNDKELLKQTLQKEYNILVEDRKFHSKGEAIMYVWYIRKYLTSPDLIIHQEAQLNRYGMPRALRADFLICNKWDIPLAVIEVNGPQHYIDEKVMERDRYKKEWCYENCIKYLYGDWNGHINIEFDKINPNYAEWENAEHFEEQLQVINKLGNINITIEQRKKNREQAYKEYIAYVKEMLDIGYDPTEIGLEKGDL